MDDIEDLPKSLLYRKSHSESEHQFRDRDIILFRETLLSWYDSNRRHLPWRGDDDDVLRQDLKGRKVGAKMEPQQQRVTPYATWVSEIMLQQTRVDTVVNYFRNWMRRFPTVEALAAASIDV